MAMDRAEIFGFGAALGVHGLLLGVFALGLMASAKTAPKPESISVSLVGEIADVSSAPDAIQEESAPPAAGETAPAEPPPAPTPVMQIEKPQTKPVPKPAKPDTSPPVSKVTPKPKSPTVSGKGTAPAKPGGLSRSFEDSINNIGKAPGAGKAVGTPATKTATEVRRSVGVSIAGQIRSRVRACAPTGVDINKIETFVTLSLEPSGKLTSVRFDRQIGLNDTNQTQAGPLKDCILQAVRAASPYDGLDPEYYDVWKTHKLRLRATG
jgi:outer membrane biosynthesis protein TonB